MMNPLVVRQNGEQIVDQTHNKFCAVDEIWRNQVRPPLFPAPTEHPTAPPIFKVGASDGAESLCKNSGQKTADDIPAEIVLKKLEKSRPLEPKSPCLPFSAVNAAQFNFLNFVAPTSPMNLCQNSPACFADLLQSASATSAFIEFCRWTAFPTNSNFIIENYQ
jgi:hypothetical protein